MPMLGPAAQGRASPPPQKEVAFIMSILRRAAALAGFVVVLATMALPLTMGVADAAVFDKAKCPAGHSHNYPPGQHCKATVSRTHVPQGGQVTITGDGFDPNEAVSIDLHSTVVHLATVHANSAGVATATVTIPLSTKVGPHTLTMTGLSSGNLLSADIVV